jgi:hypothetical protein
MVSYQIPVVTHNWDLIIFLVITHNELVSEFLNAACGETARSIQKFFIRGFIKDRSRSFAQHRQADPVP